MGQRGEFARKRPFDVHGHFSLTCCARFGYGSPRGVAVLISATYAVMRMEVMRMELNMILEC